VAVAEQVASNDEVTANVVVVVAAPAIPAVIAPTINVIA
jgi:hypothetical protein